MSPFISIFLTFGLLLLGLFLSFIVGGFMTKAAAVLQYSEKRTAFYLISTIVYMLFWLTLAFFIGQGSWFQQSSPFILLSLCYIPTLVTSLIVFRSNSLKDLICHVPKEWWIALQLYRFILGIVLSIGLFFAAYPLWLGLLLSTVEWIWGATAPVIAKLIETAQSRYRRLNQIWNALGLLISCSIPLWILWAEASNFLNLPFILIPLFLGTPLAAQLHLFALMWQKKLS